MIGRNIAVIAMSYVSTPAAVDGGVPLPGRWESS